MTTSDNIAAIERKAPGLHVTVIARLAGSFDVGQHPAWVRVEQDGNGVNGGFYTCAAATETSPAYIRADIAADLARKAEAMEREIAELRDVMRGCHAALKMMIDPGDISGSTVSTAFAAATSAESRARTLLNGGSDAAR
ncbi:hypothetical protein J2Y63_002450 [Shinella sp. BE166]|uniref:hypothetical protein n=1 Tax=Shinella sp. BE166 TaxID=3373918 RepID=UPI003EBE18AB